MRVPTSENKNNFIVIFLSLIGVISPFVIYFLSVPDRSFSYEVISRTELISSYEKAHPFKISFGDELVENASIYLIQVKNSGSEPILPSEFERPLRLIFEGRVFSVVDKLRSPTNLLLDYKIDSNSIVIRPLLLNPGEMFELEAISSSFDYPYLDSRVAGISEVDALYPGRFKDIRTAILIAVSSILTFFYSKTLYFSVLPYPILISASYRVELFVLALSCNAGAVLLISEARLFNEGAFSLPPWLYLMFYGLIIVLGIATSKRLRSAASNFPR